MFSLMGQVPGGNWLADNTWMLIGSGILLLLGIVFLGIFLNFVSLWIQCLLTGAKIGLWDLIGMRLRRVDYVMIVRQQIALVQSGVKVSPGDLEAHYLSQGNVPKTTTAVIAAHKATMDLPWETAAAIDLAGRDILDAVKTSVNPKVIDCPDSHKGQDRLSGVCKNGIQLRVRARVTVRTNFSGLIGGATEETIIARVGEGIVKAIGSAETHGHILADPQAISEAVLKNALDAQTAFEIVSLDVADIDVGANIGATLQASQAAADLRVAQAQAEKRRTLALARKQEMRAVVRENQAKVVRAEAEVPYAIAEALRIGRLTVARLRSAVDLAIDHPNCVFPRNEHFIDPHKYEASQPNSQLSMEDAAFPLNESSVKGGRA